MVSQTLSPAAERLLDAALVQVFASVPRRTAAPPSRWLAAAIIVFGLVVTAGTLLLVRADRKHESQEPAPLPPQVRADGRAAIEALPADTQHLVAGLLDADDARLLGRFTQLRRLGIRPLDLKIGPVSTSTRHRSWNDPPTDMLAAVAALPQLESLHLATHLTISADLLQPLGKSASLRDLSMSGKSARLDNSTIDALRTITNLRTLRLYLVPLNPATVLRLATLQLDELEIRDCPGFDADAWRALVHVVSLRRLVFHDLGRQPLASNKPEDFMWGPSTEDLHLLQQLPKLTSLTLQGCNIDDTTIAALPVQLQELNLWAHELTPAGFAHLQRLTSLRSLNLSTARRRWTLFDQAPMTERLAAADSVAAALASLRLTNLRFAGAGSEALINKIAQQAELTSLTLRCDPLPDLTELATLPKLRELELTCPRSFDTSELKKLLGDRVAVQVQRW